MATTIRDAVWGDIALTDRDVALVDTPAFQRLRRVRQLGFTDLVYPGARHSRFEHSLGVYHLSGLMLDRLRSIDAAPRIDEEEAAAFRAAALLHDVGHYPFSHAVEELEVDQVRRHEDIARELITSGDVASVLSEEWNVDPAVVGFIVAGPSPGSPPASDAVGLLRSCLDSSLDIDKLDYLVRDASAANVPYGTVDVQRLVATITVVDEGGRAGLAVEAKGLASLQSLLFAKHLMFATVYWHHACRAAVAMLLRSLQEALGSAELAPHDLERSDDAQLLARLAAPSMPAVTRDLSARLSERRLYKRAVEVGVDHEAFPRLEALWFRPDRRALVEDSWARSVGADPGSVLLDVPEPKPIALDLPVVVDGRAEAWERVSGLGTADLDRFQRWVRKIRVFACDGPTAAALRDRLPAELDAIAPSAGA